MPSVSRQAFSALYRKSFSRASGSRARNRMPKLDSLLVGTTPETIFDFEGTVSGGDETDSFSLWGWWADLPLGRERRSVGFLVPSSRLVEISRG